MAKYFIRKFPIVVISYHCPPLPPPTIRKEHGELTKFGGEMTSQSGVWETSKLMTFSKVSRLSDSKYLAHWCIVICKLRWVLTSITSTFLVLPEQMRFLNYYLWTNVVLTCACLRNVNFTGIIMRVLRTYVVARNDKRLHRKKCKKLAIKIVHFCEK